MNKATFTSKSMNEHELHCLVLTCILETFFPQKAFFFMKQNSKMQANAPKTWHAQALPKAGHRGVVFCFPHTASRWIEEFHLLGHCIPTAGPATIRTRPFDWLLLSRNSHLFFKYCPVPAEPDKSMASLTHYNKIKKCLTFFFSLYKLMGHRLKIERDFFNEVFKPLLFLTLLIT